MPKSQSYALQRYVELRVWTRTLNRPLGHQEFLAALEREGIRDYALMPWDIEACYLGTYSEK